MADIKIDGTDSTKINIEVADSNDLNLELTGGDKGLRTHMLETIYPVGSIYINAGVATNPGTLLGFGTWSAFGTGRTIVKRLVRVKRHCSTVTVASITIRVYNHMAVRYS